MAQQSIPASPAYKYSYYTDLLGIDLTCDVVQTPRNRASDILNLIPDDTTGNPRKRVGWRKLYEFASSTVFLGSRHIVEWGIDIIATTNGVYWHDSSLSTWTNSDVITLISGSCNPDAGVAFVGFDSNGDYLINVFKKRYKVVKTGTMTFSASEITDSYIPITIISRDPDGKDGYAYEAVNAFTTKRLIYFLGDNASTDYYFYPAADRSNHLVVAIEKVEKRDSDGVWTTVTATPKTSGSPVTAYTDQTKQTTDTYTPIVGFGLTAPAQPPVVGQDNVRATIVEFSPDVDELGNCYGGWSPIVEGVLGHNVCARYGATSMDREFYVSDNGRIYYTDPDNYDYLPDNNFIQIEVDAPIVGFHRKNTYLVAVTQDSAEFTVYMINSASSTITHSVLNEQGTREETDDAQTYFTAKTAIAGTGAISKRSFATLVDDALFLSRRGVYGITSNTVTSETVVANRSELINPRLIAESNLENAVSTIWRGMYLLCVNGHVYVLDSHNTHKNRGVSYGYECYYLNNVPATDFLSYENNLFFGDSSGCWCRFNTDINNVTAYEDDGALVDGQLTGGTAIHALYKTRLDSDGIPQYLKTLNKRGTTIEMQQLPRTSVKLSYSKDGNTPVLIGELELADRFVWSLVDFEQFSFNSATNVRTYYPKKKIKKYKYLQFILESDKVDQNFGICGVVKTYYLGNFAKR